MDLSKILALSGKSGLFRIVSRTKGGMIVESLSDGKKMPVFSSHHSSLLEDISIFTYSEEVPLKKVLWKIYEKEEGKHLQLDTKSDGVQLKNYFGQVLENYDKERVYTSDIRKVITWYNQLLDQKLITPLEEEVDKTTEEQSNVVSGEVNTRTEAVQKPTVKKEQSKHTASTPKVTKPSSKAPAQKITNTKQSKKS